MEQSKIGSLPKRPHRSNQLDQLVQPIELVSNHFRIDFINAKEQINVYSLEISPEIAKDARELKDKIITAATQHLKDQGLKTFQVRGYNVWSPFVVEKTFTVSSLVTELNEQFFIKISLVKQYSFEDFSWFDLTDTKIRNPIVQSVNISIKNALKKMGLQEIGRNAKYYDPKSINQNRIPERGLKVWRGYKTALHIFNNIPYCLIDFSSRVLRDETALQFITNLRGNQRDIQAQMFGLSVISTYGNCRIYRIDDVNFQINPQKTFTLHTGQKMTYIEYYKSKYGVEIRDTQQPLLVFRDKRNPDKITHLIPELMKMTGMTEWQRKDFGLMKEVSKFTKLEPQARNYEITNLQVQLKKGLRNFNIELNDDQKVMGHLINAPRVQLGNKELENDQGMFILRDAVLKPGFIKDWVLIYFSQNKNDDKDDDYLDQEIIKMGGKLGIKINEPYYMAQNTIRPNDWIQSIDQEIKKGGIPQMIVSFIPESQKDRLYTPLKDYCLGNIGVNHQNILLKFLNHRNKDSIASKIVQQMNVKLGNPIWSIPKPQGVSERTMLIGIDIYHKLISDNRSCLGFVASLDSNFTTYFSKVLLMKKKEQLAVNLSILVEQAITAYFEHNEKQFLPDTIVVYRDGVGEGQITTLIDTEISQFKAVFKRMSEDYQPQLAVIMINKKINHRFFALSDNQSKRIGGIRGGKEGPRNQLMNAPSGSIVADKVFNAQFYSQVVTNNFDFFLCAQYVTQGTSTPTHYTVLENTTNWTEEMFWILTYYQCFNYMNWNGAVKQRNAIYINQSARLCIICSQAVLLGGRYFLAEYPQQIRKKALLLVIILYQMKITLQEKKTLVRKSSQEKDVKRSIIIKDIQKRHLQIHLLKATLNHSLAANGEGDEQMDIHVKFIIDQFNSQKITCAIQQGQQELEGNEIINFASQSEEVGIEIRDQKNDLLGKGILVIQDELQNTKLKGSSEIIMSNEGKEMGLLILKVEEYKLDKAQQKLEDQINRFKQYVEEMGIQKSFKIIFAEILQKKVQANDVYNYTAQRLRQIGKDLEESKEKQQIQ